MKIPYVVSLSTRSAYDPSTLMLNTVPELTRKLHAEDFEFDEGRTPEPLSLIAARSLATAFTTINPLNYILQKDVDILMDLYPPDVPLKRSVPLIKDEHYWKRCYSAKFPGKIEVGEVYWKGKYLSAVLQDYLENVNPDVFQADEAADLAILVAPYIYDLKLGQLQMVYQDKPQLPRDDVVQDTCPYSVVKVYDHLPLEPVLNKLYYLEELSLVFERKNVEENYDLRYFEFSLADCESICKGVACLRNFKIFRINRSTLDCKKVKFILEKFLKIPTLEELDFNNCKIGDYGMKALGGFIFFHTNVKRIRIANNRFKEEGIQGLAYALQMKPAAPLELIDLSLNQMSFQCATMLAAAFVRCKTKPQTLIVNSCGFKGPSAEKIAGVLCLNRGLLRLELASNDLSGEAEVTLVNALKLNRNILNIDLRRTHVSEETLEKVAKLLQRNADLVGKVRTPSPPIPPLYLNEPEYLIWEYNPNNPDYIPGRYPERVAEN